MAAGVILTQGGGRINKFSAGNGNCPRATGFDRRPAVMTDTLTPTGLTQGACPAEHQPTIASVVASGETNGATARKFRISSARIN